jgi:integrase
MACVTKRRNKWVLDYRDPGKKRHCIFMPEGTTQNQAIVKLAEILKSLGQKVPEQEKEPPLFSEIADLWLASKKANIRHTTHDQYKGHLENHLKPFFGTVKINEIDFESIERFKKDVIEKKKEDAPKKRETHPMASATLRKILTTMGAVLTYAGKMHCIAYNPIKDIEKPKGNGLREEQKEMVILQPEQVRMLLDNADTPKDRILFMTAILTGARQGELLGLQWGDLDWTNSQIYVRRTYNHGKFMEPKSKTSKRKIDLAPELVHELKKWKLACPKGELDLVFPSEVGTPWDAPHMLTRHFFPALRRAKLPKINFHSLRHSYASLLIDQGENLKYISTQLGHNSIDVTCDIYGHLLKNVNQEAASKLGKTIFQVEKKENSTSQKAVGQP